ncbi:MAG TPA: hypothetical protein VHW66_04315 [Stellaceae bacterium]|jgi:hypothetical protein|nr:hypothetical protein [Stellaceae bacterium]
MNDDMTRKRKAAMKPADFSLGESYRHRHVPAGSIAAEMRAFLAGYDTGASLLHSLYDHVLDEPVPARLRAVLKS